MAWMVPPFIDFTDGTVMGASRSGRETHRQVGERPDAKGVDLPEVEGRTDPGAAPYASRASTDRVMGRSRSGSWMGRETASGGGGESLGIGVVPTVAPLGWDRAVVEKAVLWKVFVDFCERLDLAGSDAPQDIVGSDLVW